MLLALVMLNIAVSDIHLRLDLTKEKRFTLSPATKELLSNLDGKVRIRVFMKGTFPAGFRHLASSTQELLEEFQRYAGKHIVYEFINPLAGLPDTIQTKVKDSLGAMGIMPYNVKAQQDLSEGLSVQLIFPGALVDYHGHQIPVNLLQPQPGLDPATTLGHSAALLEYKFAYAIERLSQKEPPSVAYMLGNGEPLTPEVYDALSVLEQNYRFDTLNLSTTPSIPLTLDAVVFLKPDRRFSEDEKLKIDQYLMHGGKILWAIDPVNASMDSLQMKSDFLAFDQDLNLGDLLFTYGVRINTDLIQDLQCFSIPVTVGHVGNRPQIQRLPWPFQPLLSPGGNHPIVKNMDMVLSQFASSIDTTKALGIKKTILLSTSENSRLLSTPLRISLESVKIQADPREFTRSHIPVAILLDGRFSSVFQHRLDAGMLKKIDSQYQYAYREGSPETRMIVVSDGHMFTNSISREDGPLPMGMDPYTRQLFANRDFFENCLTWLTDTSDIMQARNKDFKVRLLDHEKMATGRTWWQTMDFLIPIVFILLFAVLFQYIRLRKYR